MLLDMDALIHYFQLLISEAVSGSWCLDFSTMMDCHLVLQAKESLSPLRYFRQDIFHGIRKRN